MFDATKSLVTAGRALAGAALLVSASGIGAASAAQPALSQEETYALARDAYLYAYPIVSMDVTMRQAT